MMYNKNISNKNTREQNITSNTQVNSGHHHGTIKQHTINNASETLT